MKSPLGFEKINFRSESISWDLTVYILNALHAILSEIPRFRKYLFLTINSANSQFILIGFTSSDSTYTQISFIAIYMTLELLKVCKST